MIDKNEDSVNENRSLAEQIVKVIFHRRRLLPSDPNTEDFAEEARLHIDKIMHFMEMGKPIHMILPAFPAKSSSPKKTLGIYPDKGEELALQTLNNLCKKIAELYPAGGKVTICSDGRVFAELVNVTDFSISSYKHDLISRIAKSYADTIDFFDLDDVFQDIANYDTIREELMIHYGESIYKLKARCKSEESAKGMYSGMCRFLTEDFFEIEKFKGYSKTQVRTIASHNAYRVIQRSNAWTNLLKEKFPHSLRLSIHPQPRISNKIGVFLLDSDDVWRTPWHSVAMKTETGFSLVPRHVAEGQNASLIFENGRPSYYSQS